MGHPCFEECQDVEEEQCKEDCGGCKDCNPFSGEGCEDCDETKCGGCMECGTCMWVAEQVESGNCGELCDQGDFKCEAECKKDCEGCNDEGCPESCSEECQARCGPCALCHHVKEHG